jgi:fatty acid amide hydrolase 2
VNTGGATKIIAGPAPVAITRPRCAELVGASLTNIEAAIGPHGVLLHPPYSRPAPYHRDSWRTPLDAACTAIFNVLELPVTVVPMGLGKGRLPLAVQVVGARGADAVTLAAAAALEDTFGGWVRAEP